MRTVAGSILTSGKTFFYWDFVMETNSTTILSLPLIQEGQLSVNGERMGIKYCKLPRMHAQEQCG